MPPATPDAFLIAYNVPGFPLCTALPSVVDVFVP